MKFSIVIPAYKDKYLREAIESVLTQSYKDFELIILDDASPYPISDIVELYVNDSRVRFFRNSNNVGAIHVVDNWNKCLSLASGEYVICMGDDDCLSADCLELYSNYIEKYPECNLFHGGTWLVYVLYIHLRVTGRGSRGMLCFLLIFGFACLQMCWWGINYLPAAQDSIHIYNR